MYIGIGICPTAVTRAPVRSSPSFSCFSFSHFLALSLLPIPASKRILILFVPRGISPGHFNPHTEVNCKL